jgi:type IV pilus assembly protein PilP
MPIRSTLLARLLALAALAAVLSACGGGTDDLRAYIDEVKARPGGRPQALPQIQPAPQFTYQAANRRSPFTPDARSGGWARIRTRWPVPIPTACGRSWSNFRSTR